MVNLLEGLPSGGAALRPCLLDLGKQYQLLLEQSFLESSVDALLEVGMQEMAVFALNPGGLVLAWTLSGLALRLGSRLGQDSRVA